MEISVKANALKESSNNVKGVATVTFGEAMKIRNITIVMGSDDHVFVSMPSYKTKAVDENGKAVYKDICNPITKDFREELYVAILKSYASGKEVVIGKNDGRYEPNVNVNVAVLENETGATKGIARLYLDDCFVINNVSVKENKDGELFASMPNYKGSQVDEAGKAVYKDICYPITKAFREMLQDSILEKFAEAVEMKKEMLEQETNSPFVEGEEPKQMEYEIPSRKDSVKEKLDENKEKVPEKEKKLKSDRAKSKPELE